jgi:subtilisin-like proprotein convertase family protein
MQSAPFVYTKSGLYDNLNIRVNYKDSLTPITLALCADPPSFEVVSATQPTCAGQLTGSIFVDGFGTEAVEYSINGGATFQATGTFNGLAAGSYNVVIRYIARPTCITTHPGNPVVINALTGTPVITAPTVTQPLCPVFTGTIVVNATGTGTLEYSVNGAAGPWQLSATFGLLAPGSYNIAARLQATPGCISLYSGNPVVINPVVAPVVVTQPLNKVICQNGNTTFTITDNNPVPAPTYQWQISTAGAGGPWTNLANVAPFSGVTTTTLVVTGAGIIYNGNFFRCVVTNVCGPTPSNGASLTVNPLPIVNNGPSGLCAPVTLTASGNANTYVWTPAGGLNTTTGPTVIATPTTTTVYTVTGTITATGCQNSASVTVLGTPVTPVVSPAAPVICAGDIQPLTVAPSMMTVTYSGASLAIPAPPSTGAGTGAPASVYPATVTVSGLPATGARVKSVSLNGLSHTFPADMDILLQHSPTSTNVVVLSDVGGATDIVNGNIVLDDAAATLAPAILVSGTYRPTNPAGTDQFPAPGPGGLTQTNLPLSTFTGNLNGIWNLFVTDDAGVDIGSLNNWSITFEVPTALWSPATGLYTNPAATTPYVLGTPASTVYFQQSPTVQTAYTYTVTNTLGTCTAANTGSVTVTVNPLPVFTVTPDNQCTPVTLTAAGNATTYSWSPAYGLNTTTGTTVTATPPLNTTYSVLGTITTTGCTATQTVTANATPATPVVTPTAISICEGAVTQLSVAPTAITTQNGGTITIPAGAPTTTSGPASPYPATMAIGGLPASGVRVKSVQINGISHTFPSDVDMMLRSPSGTNVTLMSDAGGSTVVSAANLVFDDAAAAVLPAAIVSGTYKPTNIGAADTYPAPGPGAITDATPALANFTGNLNGTWNLYINDQVGGDVGNITSWSITFEITGALWTPAATLFTNAAGVIPYVAGTMASPVYAKPTITTVYSATRATATCTSGTATSTVTVYNPIVITTHPATQTVCQGVNVTFSVVHSGNFPAYQWQLSTDNGTTWGPIAGANSSSITLPAVTTALSGRRYRVVITNTCTTVTSNAAILTVNPLSTVVATDLFTQRICISDTLVPLVGTPVGGSWSGIGVSGFNFVPGATAIGGPYVLTYTYTNTFGCTTTDTTSVRVVDCPERIRLLRNDGAVLYPNPNNGNFFIRMNSVLYSYLAMDVYTSAGHLVSRKQFGGLVYGRVIPVNLTHLPTGIYLVKLYYDDGVRTSEKTFEVMIGRQ